mgnify:CR=1 FL=1
MLYSFIHKLRHLMTIFMVFGGAALYAQIRVEGLSYLDKKPISVEIKDGKIIRVDHIEKLSDESHPVFISPGLIDNQVNGFAGVTFNDTHQILNKEGIRKITSELWKKGVTTYFPTLTSSSREIMVRTLALLAGERNDEMLRGSIPGYHLEGPYLSPIDGYRGAHPLKYVRDPDWNEFMDMYKAADGRILTVTIAPELKRSE